ncbi:LysR family transcriptional regulator [Pendulispora albinea]|uniref:LysR family transcriptional regulator n=1 Tax=Pendulispora albinea TaxID=2741071 RepID=A0ABZ2LQ45_9BACT
MKLTASSVTLEWSDVRIFLAVAVSGSYAKAARRTGVSVMTVGRRIQALESSLGVRLVERLPNGYRPTSEGHALLPAATQMAAAADDLLRTASRRDPRVVRLSATEWDSMFVVRHVRALRALVPRLDLEVQMAHQPPSLARREIDLVLIENLPQEGALVSRRLGAMAFAIYGSAAYVARNKHARDEKKRFSKCDWVGFDAEHEYMPVSRWLTERRRAPATYRFTNAVAILEGVRASVGLALLPCWIADSEPNLIRLSPPLDDPTHPTFALFAADRRRDPILRAAVDGLARVYRAEAGALRGEKA